MTRWERLRTKFERSGRAGGVGAALYQRNLMQDQNDRSPQYETGALHRPTAKSLFIESVEPDARRERREPADCGG